VHIYDVLVGLIEVKFNVGVLASLFGEDLDPDVVVLVRGQAVVIAINLTEKYDCRRAGSLRFAGHFQFVRGDRRKALGNAPDRQEHRDQKDWYRKVEAKGRDSGMI
jgi:hypothetical protein